jgi:hypothetical protein
MIPCKMIVILLTLWSPDLPKTNRCWIIMYVCTYVSPPILTEATFLVPFSNVKNRGLKLSRFLSDVYSYEEDLRRIYHCERLVCAIC